MAIRIELYTQTHRESAIFDDSIENELKYLKQFHMLGRQFPTQSER